MIDDDVEIVIVEIKENTVKLGIRAPKVVKVFRKEIFDEIKRANILASETSVELPKLNQPTD